MREPIHEPVASSFFASKRLVVSACAAIAMVLGATSVGASLFNVSEPPAFASSQSYISDLDPSTVQPVLSKDSVSLEVRLPLSAQPLVRQPAVYKGNPTPSKVKKGLSIRLQTSQVKVASAALYVNPSTADTPAKSTETAAVTPPPVSSQPSEPTPPAAQPVSPVEEPSGSHAIEPATPPSPPPSEEPAPQQDGATLFLTPDDQAQP